MEQNLHVCILAAGQSKRMKSKTSKLLHPVCGKPMVEYLRVIAEGLQPATFGMVVGFQRDQIIQALAGKPLDFIIQEEQLGTGHAVNEYLKHNPGLQGILLVISGDTPLLRAEMIRELIAVHRQQEVDVSLVTTELDVPKGYGRIVRDSNGLLERIVEEVDASEKEARIHEVNAGIYVFDIAKLRELLPLLQPENKQKEYYLPDVVALSLQRGWKVVGMKGEAEEVMGINTRAELAAAGKIMRRRINEAWMLQGVTLYDPSATYIDAGVELATDVTIYPNVLLEGSTRIGSDVTIYGNCRIVDSNIGSGCVIYENCSIDSAQVDSAVRIGPFARLRPGTVLRSGVHIGNFVELKKTTVDEGSKANHLSYLGDATIGRNVNVGAGTITCNYDGEKKHPTLIENDVFIGSDTQLIAPVKIGKGAYVAAGSSITDDVPEGSLAIARARQVNKVGWVKKKKRKD